MTVVELQPTALQRYSIRATCLKTTDEVRMQDLGSRHY
jgi:hypothetical protein